MRTPLARQADEEYKSFFAKQGNEILSGVPVLGILGKAVPGVTLAVWAHFESLVKRVKTVNET